MNYHPARLAAHRIGLIAISFALLTPVLAQQPRPPGDVDPARARFEDTSRREMQLRGLAGTGKKLDQKQIQALIAQVKEDFERILTLHNEIVRAIRADRMPANDYLSNAAAEIKKRAGRLKSSLALDRANASDPEKLPKVDDAHVKEALLVLCKHIESFFTNPVIKDPGTVDVGQLSKARGELECIVELSGNIKKVADSLNKTSK